jgi:hypothetical protein
MIPLAEEMLERVARSFRSTTRMSFTTSDLLSHIRERAWYTHVL